MIIPGVWISLWFWLGLILLCLLEKTEVGLVFGWARFCRWLFEFCFMVREFFVALLRVDRLLCGVAHFQTWHSAWLRCQGGHDFRNHEFSRVRMVCGYVCSIWKLRTIGEMLIVVSWSVALATLFCWVIGHIWGHLVSLMMCYQGIVCCFGVNR